MKEYGISQSFYELLGLAAFYLILRILNQRSLKLLLIAVLISGATQAIYGNLQLYGIFTSHHNMFNITGGFFNPGPYAGFLAVVFPIALVILLNYGSAGKSNDQRYIINIYKKKISIPESLILRNISIVTIISILLVLPSTRSRSAWLSVILTSSLILVYHYNVPKEIQSRFNTYLKKAGLFVILMSLVTVTAFGLYSMKKNSADGRLLIWKVTANMIKDSSIIGFGYDRFKANYLNYQADYFKSFGTAEEAINADNTTRAFNEYLQITAEAGISGLLLFIGIGWSAFFSKYNEENNGFLYLSQGSKMGILSFGIFALFSYPTEILPIKVCITICLALLASTQKSCEIAVSQVLPAATFRYLKTTGSLLLVISLLVLINPLKKYYQNIRQWKQAFQTYQMGEYAQSVLDYSTVEIKNNGDYLINYGKAYSMAGEHETAIDVLSRAEKFLPNTILYTALGDSYKAMGKSKRAEMAYLKASQILPGRFYPKYLLAKLYNETNQSVKAVQIANQLLKKEIKIESIAINEIKNEMLDIVNRQD